MLAERSSAGNDNKRRVAKCAEPVLPQEEGRTPRVLKVTNKKVPRLLSSLSIFLKLCYSGRSRWPVSEKEKAAVRADFSSVLESEGSAQLWTACLLSVCLSPSKSTPSHIFFPLCHISCSFLITSPA